MKKLVFGLGLLLSGVIGFVGFCIAAAQTVQPGASSTVFGCFHGMDWLVTAVFVILALIGLVLAIQSVAQKESSR